MLEVAAEMLLLFAMTCRRSEQRREQRFVRQGGGVE